MDAFKDETGRRLLSKTAVAQIGKQPWEDYQAFKTRDLAEYDIAYLFIDGIAPGQKREPVLAAWGVTFDGRKVLLHLMAGSKEDAETVSAFFQDMRARGLDDPLLVVSDGATGIIKAIEVCFPRSTRQRCLAHRMRNLAAKVPQGLWPEFKARATAAYQAPSGKIARELADGIVADYGTELANAVGCFMSAGARSGSPSSSAARWLPSDTTSITRPPSTSIRPAQSLPPPSKFPAPSGLDRVSVVPRPQQSSDGADARRPRVD
jgi:putative transposase